MRIAVQILIHALRMIFGNPGKTLRALSPGLVIMFGAGLAMLVAAPELVESLINNRDLALDGGPAFIGLLAVLLMVVGFVIVVVRWHRYVLLEQVQSVQVPVDAVMRYIGIAILIALIAALISIPVGLVFGAVIITTQGNSIIVTLMSLAASGFLGWALMRYSLPLPAVAIGSKMRFTESWQRTAALSGPILWVSIGVSVVNEIIGAAADAIALDMLIVKGTVSLITVVVTGLIGASVLTTLYGMLIEGRTLDR